MRMQPRVRVTHFAQPFRSIVGAVDHILSERSSFNIDTKFVLRTFLLLLRQVASARAYSDPPASILPVRASFPQDVPSFRGTVVHRFLEDHPRPSRHLLEVMPDNGTGSTQLATSPVDIGLPLILDKSPWKEAKSGVSES